MMSHRAGQPERTFLLEYNRGGISSLKLKEDALDTEYITPGETLGEVLIATRSGDEERRPASTFASGDI